MDYSLCLALNEKRTTTKYNFVLSTHHPKTNLYLERFSKHCMKWEGRKETIWQISFAATNKEMMDNFCRKCLSKPFSYLKSEQLQAPNTAKQRKKKTFMWRFISLLHITAMKIRNCCVAAVSFQCLCVCVRKEIISVLGDPCQAGGQWNFCSLPSRLSAAMKEQTSDEWTAQWREQPEEGWRHHQCHHRPHHRHPRVFDATLRAMCKPYVWGQVFAWWKNKPEPPWPSLTAGSNNQTVVQEKILNFLCPAPVWNPH